MKKFECGICQQSEDSQTVSGATSGPAPAPAPKSSLAFVFAPALACDMGQEFIPCVLNCSHMFCLSCMVAHITQFKPPKASGLADPVEEADLCPLCLERISIIIPLSQIVSGEGAQKTIKYFNDMIKTAFSDDVGVVETLRENKSNISRDINALCRNNSLTPLVKKQRLIELITPHSLLFSEELFGSKRLVGKN